MKSNLEIYFCGERLKYDAFEDCYRNRAGTFHIQQYAPGDFEGMYDSGVPEVGLGDVYFDRVIGNKAQSCANTAERRLMRSFKILAKQLGYALEK